MLCEIDDTSRKKVRSSEKDLGDPEQTSTYLPGLSGAGCRASAAPSGDGVEVLRGRVRGGGEAYS